MVVDSLSFMPRRRPISEAFGQELIAAAQEMLAIERGEREPARVSIWIMPADFQQKPSWVRGRRDRGGRNRTRNPYLVH